MDKAGRILFRVRLKGESVAAGARGYFRDYVVFIEFSDLKVC